MKSTIVFAFGRFQPPTVGHKILIDVVTNIAATHNAQHAIYVSRTHDRKTNPVPVDIKMYFLQKLFPNTNFVAANDQARTFIEAAILLNKKYNNLIMIAGSDRVKSYTELLNKYNGIEFNYDSITVISAGERDPDSDDATGMSGTKMRLAAINNDLTTFKNGVFGLTDNEAIQLMQYIQQGSTPMKKNKQASVHEGIINEGPSVETTVRAISNDIGEPVTQLYNTLKSMAKQYVENNGSLKGFQLIAAGAANRWYQTFYFNRLQKELYHLTQFSPKRTTDLQALLSKLPKSFNALSGSLPEILAKIGDQLGATNLKTNAVRWVQNRAEFENYLNSLETDEEDNIDNTPPPVAKSTLPGQQHAQVDQIVNDVLKSLPKSIAGNIRNAIARSPNKLQALKHEMSRLNNTMKESFDAVGDNDRLEWVSRRLYNTTVNKQVPIDESIQLIMNQSIRLLKSK